MRTHRPSEFEAAVFRWIATRMDDPVLTSQLVSAVVLERDHTRVGCYSQLGLPKGAAVMTAKYGLRGPINGPTFESPELEHGGGTLLWCKEGLVDCLEVYSHGDFFPEDHDELGAFGLEPCW